MVPKDMLEHTTVSIEGVDNATVIRYMDDMNANDFDALIELFAPDGAMHPPFQKPIVGKEAILQFLQEDCKNLKVVPESGVEEPAEEGFEQFRVKGKVYSPWLNAWVNVAWRFSLNLEGKISLVAIEVIASPKELLKFVS
ncbi:ketosteroid isomerase family protein [Oscillatoria sp. FACHB-1406]|uniref:nuclear transport factor 2 family protein n=1 Tax=Oscillatoria sp. FACHB-1406 TaxID=2692846 RepID=UPI0016864BA8|nr:ketosteroid isomerase family protein [Oscillatoria sp. FACHB-1406]MBD2577327.1 nuclear transport factor 2 family protein [Oscillatoria sp. FACHB-1406]